MIDVMLLGTGAMIPLPGRPLSSALMRVDGELILFDCGEGTQTVWRSYRWGFKHLSAICLTHLHADHVAGIPGLLHTVANSGRTEPLAIYGPAGTAAVIAGLRVIAPSLPYPVIVHELQPGACVTLPADLTASVAAGFHSVPVLGYRVERARQPGFDAGRARALDVPVTLWSRLQRGETVTVDGRTVTPASVLGPPRPGIAFAFITDTRPVPDHVALAKGAQLLICEGTYGPSSYAEKAKRSLHMTFAEAATIAREAGAERLWLTHFGAGLTDPAEFLPDATATFPSTRVGQSGLMAELSFGKEIEETVLTGSADEMPGDNRQEPSVRRDAQHEAVPHRSDARSQSPSDVMR